MSQLATSNQVGWQWECGCATARSEAWKDRVVVAELPDSHLEPRELVPVLLSR
jgi:hypothetical protein